MSQCLKPLKIIKNENEYKIRQYIKTLELIQIEEPKLTKWQKFKRFVYDRNPIYNQLTTKQKQLLHTIAPLWANIVENNLQGNIIVRDDLGRIYDLNSMNGRHCLVRYVYGFGDTTCSTCFRYNINFAGLNSRSSRNCDYLSIRNSLPAFLDHYYHE